MSESRWTETDLAYFAGIIDGEGSFSLSRQGHSHRYVCRLSVGNTSVTLIDWIKQRFGGLLYFEHDGSLKHKPCYRWSADAPNFDAIISAVKPFLVIKRQQAELLEAYRRTLAPMIDEARSTYKTGEAVKTERTRINAELRLMNRRGA